MKGENGRKRTAAEVIHLAELVYFISRVPGVEDIEHHCGETRRHLTYNPVEAFH